MGKNKLTTHFLTRLLAGLCVLAVHSTAKAAITNVIEVGLGGDTAAIISQNLAEDSLALADRPHQLNGPAFTADVLNTPSGTEIVDLPSYLVGGDHVRFSNDARDNAGYSATIEADVPTTFYLLIDNRVNGPVPDANSSRTTDPVLGGTLQWVIDGGWQRVNTGISPAGQADYVGIDEGGNQSGAGMGLNQFYSVYRLSSASLSTTVQNNGVCCSNMIAVVGVPAPISGAAPVPALPLWGLAVLASLMMGIGAGRLRRKQ